MRTGAAAHTFAPHFPGTNMLARLFLLFAVTSAVELWLLLKVGALIGVWPTLSLIVLTGFAGAWFARREGRRALGTMRAELQLGKMPGDAIIDGLCMLVAGALLVTPGVLTDLFGFMLLIPVARSPLKRGMRRAFERAVASGRTSASVTWVEMGPGGARVVRAERQAGPTDGAIPPGVTTPRNARLYRSGDVIDVSES